MGSQSRGRYISKNEQQRYPEIEVEAFSFGSLSSHGALVPDNPRKSVVHKKLHTDKELSEKVQEAEMLRTQLQPRKEVIPPSDYTVDYNRTLEELRIKNRRKLMDEEEAVAQELADMMERNRETLKQVSWKENGKKGGAQSVAQRANDTSAAEMADAAGARPESLQVAAGIASAAGVRESHPMQSQQSQQLQQLQHQQNQQQQSSQAGENSIYANSNSPSGSDIEKIRQSVRDEVYEEVRQQIYDSVSEQARVEGLQAGRDEGIAQGQEEGSRSGYEDGFRVGEQRGEISGEAKVDKTLSLLAQVMHQIDLLRSEILASGQEIFVEFAKAAAESILRSQLAVHDDTLKNFLLNTMSPFVEKSFLNIEVGGIDAKRIVSVLAEYPDLQKRVKIRENSQLASGDFRVEADNEVVVVDIKKAVNDFMESIKADILSSNVDSEKSNKGAA